MNPLDLIFDAIQTRRTQTDTLRAADLLPLLPTTYTIDMVREGIQNWASLGALILAADGTIATGPAFDSAPASTERAVRPGSPLTLPTGPTQQRHVALLSLFAGVGTDRIGLETTLQLTGHQANFAGS